MTNIISNCNVCNAEYTLEFVKYGFWESENSESTFECPNCSTKHKIDEFQCLKSLIYNNVKIIKRFDQNQIVTGKNAFNIELDSKEVHRILKK